MPDETASLGLTPPRRGEEGGEDDEEGPVEEEDPDDADDADAATADPTTPTTKPMAAIVVVVNAAMPAPTVRVLLCVHLSGGHEWLTTMVMAHLEHKKGVVGRN
jgi:hypothetical protein